MILIISEKNDLSTNQVIDWLIFFKKEFVRINAEDSINLDFNGNDVEIKFSSNKIKLSEITSYWYRRGFLNYQNNFLTKIPQFDFILKEEVNNFLNYIHYKLSKLKHINSFTNEDMNKLIVSDIARQLGIHTPNDLIFSNKESLKTEIENTNDKYISKITSGRTITNFKRFSTYNYSSLINIKNISDDFFPSLVQNYIDKKYELRIFYLEGKFYSMAIFSQNENQTSIDFRNINKEKMNRYVSYKLPNEIEIKLDLLMQKLDLNCGSIDMIVTPNNEYVFLEVNPVGQFGMTSYPCNYNLEKIIAEYL